MPTNNNYSNYQLVQIRKLLQENFNLDEFRQLCFMLSVDYDYLAGETRTDKMRELIFYMNRRDKMDELIALCARERSHVDWPSNTPPDVPIVATSIVRNPRLIFISHASEDALFAQRLAKDLRTKGWEIWIAPESIRPGEKWVDTTNRGLDESGIFLLVLSPHAVASKWVVAEMNAAINLERMNLLRLIPLDVLPVTLTPVLWQTYQWISFRASYEAGFQKLLQAISLYSSPVLPNLPVSDSHLSKFHQIFRYLLGYLGFTASFYITQAAKRKLTRLDLSGYGLTAIPSEIGQLTSLVDLDLRNNALTSLPPEIGRLKALESLRLENNQLTAVPPELLDLVHLKHLDLRGNPLPIPLGVVEDDRNPQAILGYIHQNLLPKRRPLHEVKLLVVGQGSVGKTSLIRRLVQGIYHSDENKTEGIIITPWSLTVNNKVIQVNIWDFGGQEIMHATHQFFLTQRSLYLLILDNRTNDADNRIDYWLQIIQSFGANSPIILVGNKCDQHPLDIDKRGLLHKYPNIKAIIETSCATSEGIQTLQAAICQEIDILPQIYNTFPTTWFALKRKLEAMDCDYLPYDKYLALCQETKINDPNDPAQLIHVLHDLGVVLHFDDDPRLQETSILNPLWVTQAVYKILNYRPLLANNGLLTLQNLFTILDSPAYPRTKQIYILEMLRKFELSYELEGQRDTVLLPDLLPKEQPDLSSFSFSPFILESSALSFEYHYNLALPSSIISRFIVRLHPYICKGIVWRSGVVLAYQENQALVRADYDARKIFISIIKSGDGPVNSRRTFLAIIRSHFEAIHGSFSGLSVQEKISLSGYPYILEDYHYLIKLEKAGETHFVPRDMPPDLPQKVAIKDFLVEVILTAPEERGNKQKSQRHDLLETMTTCFTKEEIRKLCFELGVNYQRLEGNTLDEWAMSLIEMMERNGRLTELLILVQEHRPKASGKWIVGS